MKSILVTGSSGTIGTRLCEKLLSDGYGVIGVDKVPNRWSGEIDALTVVGDLRQPKTLEGLPSSFDLVIHLAANARVHNLVLDPTLAFENMHSTFRVIEFCRRSGIPRLIFASSREVYGDTDGASRSEEQTHVNYCESPYTASKMSGEAMVKAYERCYGMRCVIARFSNVYGMYDVSDRIVPLYIKHAQRNEDLVIYGRDKTLDFTYIDDAVAGICACIERHDDVAGMTMNIASGRATRVADVAETIRKSLDSASTVVFRENRTGEVQQFVADLSAAKKHLGYEPQIGIEEGLGRSIAWYLRCTDPDWVHGTLRPAGLAATKSKRRSHGNVKTTSDIGQ